MSHTHLVLINAHSLKIKSSGEAIRKERHLSKSRRFPPISLEKCLPINL